jgi:hypothetical protein
MVNPKCLLTYLIAILTQITFSASVHADVMIKVETRVSVPGGASAASGSKGVSTYYVRGEARRNDTISPLGSHTAVIRQCDTGAGYFVDFDRKEYHILATLAHSDGGLTGAGRVGPSAAGTLKSPADVVTAETSEVGQTKKILGHPARHFVTKVKETISDPGSSKREVTEVIDGWYLTDVQNPATNCTPQDMIDQPSVWIGAPVLPKDGEGLQYEHTGPTPKGLAVQVRRSSDAAILERKVVELSDATLDPALFEVPRDFKEVARPQSHDSRLSRP